MGRLNKKNMTIKDLLEINHFLRSYKNEWLKDEEIEGMVNLLLDIEREVERIQLTVEKMKENKTPEQVNLYVNNLENQKSELEIKPIFEDSPKHFKGLNGGQMLIVKKFLIK